MANPEIYVVHGTFPQSDGSTHRAEAGRFMILNGHVHHLSSYYDGDSARAVLAGPVTAETARSLTNPPPHLHIAKRDDIGRGEHLDFVAEHPLEHPYVEEDPRPESEPPRPPSVFLYQHELHDKPHLLEVHRLRCGPHSLHPTHRYSLDGNTLTDTEVRKILDNLKSRRASLRYRDSEVERAVRKAASTFSDLRKVDDNMDPNAALLHLEGLGHHDATTLRALKSLRRQVYMDPLAEGLGNRYSFEEAQRAPRGGVWLSMDGNSFKKVNDKYGHPIGDEAIKAYGRAIRESADEVGTQHSKTYRHGGDEFAAHFTAPEHAYRFISRLRDRLAAIPPIQGEHQLSMAIGMGPDYGTADQALLAAKTQRYKVGKTGRKYRAYKSGNEPNYVHSLSPGGEGPVPVYPPTEAERVTSPTSMVTPEVAPEGIADIPAMEQKIRHR